MDESEIPPGVRRLLVEVRAGLLDARLPLADLLLELADANVIAAVLLDMRRQVSGHALLSDLPLVVVVSGVLRDFLVRRFAQFVLLGGVITAKNEHLIGTATIADLVRFRGEQLLGKNGGVPGFGPKRLLELRLVLGFLGWQLADDDTHKDGKP